MPVNWKDPNAFTRLLAAMVAAQDMKLDYRKIATMYGQGATYDSIEGRFRIIKKEAMAMKAEIDSGERAQAPARGSTTTTSAATTPRKSKAAANNTPKKERIIGGRVTKGNNGFGMPSKKRANGKGMIKAEPDSSTSTSPFQQTPTPTPTPEDGEPSSSYDSTAFAVDGNSTTTNTATAAATFDAGDDELALFYESNNNDFVDTDGMDIEAF